MVDGVPAHYGPQRIIRVYVATNALFTLSASLIWAVNTLFLLRAGGMSFALVFVINAVYTASQMLFEVPTGVIADTMGRKLSFLLSIGILVLSTLVYVLSAQLHWGFWGFVVGSVLIGLGFTFQTGAVSLTLGLVVRGRPHHGINVAHNHGQAALHAATDGLH